MEKALHEVVVKVITDPGGDPAILLQLPNGWITLSPEGAREIARALTLTAEELE